VTPLTVRLEGGEVIASDDNGRTARLDGDIGQQILEAWQRAEPKQGPDLPSAGALTAIGEAQRLRPHLTAEVPDWRANYDGPRVALGAHASEASRPLAEILAGRRSQTSWSTPLAGDVAAALIRTGRVAGWRDGPDGYVVSQRPAPSAGGRHPLDLELWAGDVSGLVPGRYSFDPLTCELVLTDSSPADGLAELGRIVGAAEPPPAAIVAVAQTQRTLSRYPAGMSLIWRDAGVLLGFLHLCCADLGLASCIVGNCGVLVHRRSPLVVDVGSVVLGGPPLGDPRPVAENGPGSARLGPNDLAAHAVVVDLSRDIRPADARRRHPS